MDEVTLVGTQQNGTWLAFAYDLHYHYGYETMLWLFDRFVSDYQVCVERIAKATVAGDDHTVVWQKFLFSRGTKSLSEIKALKEECGEVAVGGIVKALDNLQIYMVLMNQTSIVTFQIPDDQFSMPVKKQIESIAMFLQSNILSKK